MKPFRQAVFHLALLGLVGGMVSLAFARGGHGNTLGKQGTPQHVDLLFFGLVEFEFGVR